MASFTFKSEQQILGDQLANFLSSTGISDLNPGSFIRTLLESNATELFQEYVQLVQILDSFMLDSTTGADLDNRAAEYNLTRYPAQKATGLVRILRDSTFVKVSTSLYSGYPAPVVGDTVLRVNDASNSLYATSGTLIVGRGTANEEEVTYTAAPTNFTNYWQFTVSAFANNHGNGESVILKQGSDEVISAGTVVQVPAAGTSPTITFTVNQDTTLLSGEAYVDNVEVTAVQAGSSGNIPASAINGTSAFASAPFAGAQATNLAKFTTGQDLEIDSDLRNRIQNTIQSLSNATEEALFNAIIGVTDPSTAKRVVSANIVEPTTSTDPVKIYIDDGTGFEESFESQGLETIIDEAVGGETRLQLELFPLMKASVETNVAGPYNMSSGNLTLTYQVGLQSETITFYPSDFLFPTSVKAQDIVSIINLRATLIEAKTAQVGTTVVISAISDTNEDIQVTGGTANSILNFPTDSRSTLYLYVNDQLLSKDGSTAYIDTQNQQTYNFSSLGGSGPWPLTVIVDQKSSNTQTVNFHSTDFANAAAGLASEVVTVINNQLAGATASLINNSVDVRITSNLQLSSKSGIQVTGGSANTILGFPTTASIGTNNDYTLNRNLGSIQLNSALAKNATVTAGSQYTRGELIAANPENYQITSGQTLVIAVDGGSDQTIIFSSTSLLSASQVAALINASLQGATATSREIGGLNYLVITTNTYDQSSGSIKIESSSTATIFGFTTNTLESNERPHQAYITSSIAAPYSFVQGQNLVMVIDEDTANKTFAVNFDYSGTITGSTSTTEFQALALNTVFTSNNILQNFYVVAKSGANTTTGTITTVANVSGSTWKYTFSTLPTNFTSFAVGDHAIFSGMQNSANNGNFLITGIDTTNGWVEVTNSAGIAESNSTGSALIGQRRLVSSNTATTGDIVASSAFRAAFAINDTFTLIPSTLVNVVNYLNNKKVTTLSTVANIAASNNNSKIQISSLSFGSDGYVQVTGGSANTLIGFQTTVVRGLQGYNYATGLLKQVYLTVYGDDTNLVSFPGVGAAGIPFQIKAPTITDVTVSATVTLDKGVAISNVETDINSAISGYINSLGIGEDVIVSSLIQVIMEVIGVTDVVVNTPSSNIVVQSHELARTNSSLITIGVN